MRWDQLFDDLESQLESELGADDADVRAEEERLRLGRLALRDRLIGVHANGSGLVRLGIVGGKRLIVRPMAFGRDWLSGELIAESHRRTQCVVPLSAVAAVVLNSLVLYYFMRSTGVCSTASGSRLSCATSVDVARR